MIVTSRERVLAAFDHEQPDRVPSWCGATAEFWAKAKRGLALDDEGLRLRFGDDFRRILGKIPAPNVALAPAATMQTAFGVQRTGIGYGMAMSHPLADATLAEVHAYPWPDPNQTPQLVAESTELNGRCAVLGGCPSVFWHDLIDLLGMENMCLKMYDDPLLIDTILQYVVDFYIAFNQKIFDKAGSVIDIFFLANDFGSRQGPLLSEKMFRRFIVPHLRRLIILGHAYNLKVMLHCCGGIAELIPAMIETGLDGLHAVQPSCRGMDLVKLKKEFGDKMLFNGAIDSQAVLIDGTPETVRQKTREVLDIMKPGGGYVAGASHDTILGETPLENVLAMFDTIQEYGEYAA